MIRAEESTALGECRSDTLTDLTSSTAAAHSAEA